MRTLTGEQQPFTALVHNVRGIGPTDDPTCRGFVANPFSFEQGDARQGSPAGFVAGPKIKMRIGRLPNTRPTGALETDLAHLPRATTAFVALDSLKLVAIRLVDRRSWATLDDVDFHEPFTPTEPARSSNHRLVMSLTGTAVLPELQTAVTFAAPYVTLHDPTVSDISCDLNRITLEPVPETDYAAF